MILYESVPKTIQDKRTTWGSIRDAFLNKVQKEEEYYYNDVEGTGTNFTVEQLKKIGEGTQIPVTINYLHPVCNQKLAILTQTKPAFKIVGLDDRGKRYSHALDKAVRSIMYKSEAVGEEEEAIKNMLILGMGINGITELEEFQFGTFGVGYENIHPSMIILDPNCRKRSLKDMSGYFYEKEITLEEAKKKYQAIIDIINERELGGSTPITLEGLSTSMITTARGAGRLKTSGIMDTIMISEYYDKVYTTKYFIEDIDTGGIQHIFAENLEEDQRFILDSAVDKEMNTFVRKSLIIGDKLIAIEMKSVKDFPIKVKFFEWGGSPYKSYGMIHFTRGMQEAYDKSIQSMLLNGMLTNNAGYLSPVGAIKEQDRYKWETQGSRPGAVKEYAPQGQDGSLRPEREQIQQLSNFYPTITEMMKQGIYDSTGINPMVQGNPSEGKVDVFASLQQYNNAAMQRIQLAMSHINLANEQLGNICLDYLVANIGIDQTYSFFDEKNALQEISIAKDLAKDFKLGRYTVLSIASEAMPTQRMGMATELMKISQTTPDPIERSVYVQKAFELSDMRGFDEMQEQVDTAKKLQGQVQQLNEQLERVQEINKQLENRTIAAEIKVKIAEGVYQAMDKVTTAEGKVSKDLEIAKLKEELKEARKPVGE